MVCVWLLFAFLLFVGEPFILRRHLPRWAILRPEATPSHGCIGCIGSCWRLAS